MRRFTKALMFLGAGAAGAMAYERKCHSRACNKREAQIDDTIDDSFPASDPPSWSAGSGKPGAPGA